MSQLAKVSEATGLVAYEEKVQLLDQYEGSITYDPNAEGRRHWAATISAGFRKEGEKNPTISRDGKFFLHEDQGEAPGIRAICEARQYRSLTITLLEDDPQKVLRQIYAAYGTVKMFGDASGITCIKIVDGQQVRTVITPDHPKWEETRRACKVSTFVFFHLAEWNEDGTTNMVFLDGLAPYRLRMTSRNAVRKFLDTMTGIRRITNGRLAGVPLELSLAYPTILTPQLERRKMPVWTLAFKPPGGMKIGTTGVIKALGSGIEDASRLALEAPQVSYEEIANADEHLGEVIDGELVPDEAALTQAERAQSVDTRIGDFFRLMQGTRFCDAEHRAEAVGTVTNWTTMSLKAFAEDASPEQWEAATHEWGVMAANERAPFVPPAPVPAVADADPYGDDLPAQPVALVPPVDGQEALL